LNTINTAVKSCLKTVLKPYVLFLFLNRWSVWLYWLEGEFSTGSSSQFNHHSI